MHTPIEIYILGCIIHICQACHLKNRNFDLKDAPSSDRPVEFHAKRLKQILHENYRLTTREQAKKIKCSHTAIEKDHHWIGKAQKCGAWLTHALSDNNKNQRATISTALLARHRSTDGHKQPFLYLIVTDGDKCCLYVNMKQRKEELSPGKQATRRV